MGDMQENSMRTREQNIDRREMGLLKRWQRYEWLESVTGYMERVEVPNRLRGIRINEDGEAI
jgi:hypothetical protein